MALNHVLSSSLSNSLKTLTIVCENANCSGVGKFFLSAILSSASQKTEVVLLLLNPASLEFYSEVLRVLPEDSPVTESCAVNLIPTLAGTPVFPEIPETFTVFIDSLALLEHWNGHAHTLQFILQRLNNGVVAVLNSSSLPTNSVLSYKKVSGISIEMIEFSLGHGRMKSTHKRGVTKLTQGKSDFSIFNGVISARKTLEGSREANVPTSTFRMGVSEEENKRRKQVPLPYEKNFITVEPEDYISSDEDGDEDEYYG